MKSLIAISFLLSFAMQTFSGAFIVLDYFTNTTAFAKNCENKAKPQMHCNGKCQMRKQVQQEQQKDQQSPERRGENKNEHVIASQSFFTYIPSFAAAQIFIYPACFTCGKEQKMPRSIFHPPGA